MITTGFFFREHKKKLAEISFFQKNRPILLSSSPVCFHFGLIQHTSQSCAPNKKASLVFAPKLKFNINNKKKKKRKIKQF